MALTAVPCLIGQAACGRVAGDPVCPKCGMDERVVYPGQADLEFALDAARRRYFATFVRRVRKRIERSSSENARSQAEIERVELEREGQTALQIQAQREAIAKQRVAQGQLQREEVKRGKAEEELSQAEKELKERKQLSAQFAKIERDEAAKRTRHLEKLRQDRLAELAALRHEYLETRKSTIRFSQLFFFSLMVAIAGAWKLWGGNQWVDLIGIAVLVFVVFGLYDTWLAVSDYTEDKRLTVLILYLKLSNANPNGAPEGSPEDQYIKGFRAVEGKYSGTLGFIGAEIGAFWYRSI